MAYLKWLLALIATLVLTMSAFLFYMKFHDGPIEIFAGGAFQTGELVPVGEPDWNQFKDRDTLQFQLLEPVSSRTTWLAVHKDKIYTLSAYMNSPVGKVWKKWPIFAMKDGRALVRLDDKIYPRQLVRVAENSELILPILQEINRKYHMGADQEKVKNNDLWVFELAPRPEK